MANPMAMLQAVAAFQALELVGMPEARLSLSQAIIAVCESPKSNSVVEAMSQAQTDAENGRFSAVPMYLRDTHYKGHERLGNGEGYLYPHDFPGHYVKQNYMPEGFEDTVYYRPGNLGFEKDIKKKKDADE